MPNFLFIATNVCKYSNIDQLPYTAKLLRILRIFSREILLNKLLYRFHTRGEILLAAT